MAVANVCKYRQVRTVEAGLITVLDFFHFKNIFKFDYFDTAVCGLIALHFPGNALCNMQQDFVQVVSVTLCLV